MKKTGEKRRLEFSVKTGRNIGGKEKIGWGGVKKTLKKGGIEEVGRWMN